MRYNTEVLATHLIRLPRESLRDLLVAITDALLYGLRKNLSQKIQATQDTEFVQRIMERTQLAFWLHAADAQFLAITSEEVSSTGNISPYSILSSMIVSDACELHVTVFLFAFCAALPNDVPYPKLYLISCFISQLVEQAFPDTMKISPYEHQLIESQSPIDRKPKPNRSLDSPLCNALPCSR